MSSQVTWVSLSAEFARLLAVGHRYVVLIANPRNRKQVAPFTQVSWRDDCRMQLEAVSNTFLDHKLDDVQCAMLQRLGFSTPGYFGDDYLNWVQFRNGEGTEPHSVARFLVFCLKSVYRVQISDANFEWITSEELFDIHAAIDGHGFK